MKVLMINQFFYPDVAAVAQLMGELAEDLIKEGVEVTVIRGRAKYIDRTNEQNSHKALFKKTRIYKTFSINLRGRNSFVHLLNYLSFHVSALFKAVLIRKQDYVFAFTTPPLIAIVGMILKAVKGTKFVYIAEDLYPEVAVELKFLKRNGFFAKFALALSNSLLRRADIVIALNEDMRRRIITKGVDEDKVIIIHNWADGEQIYPIPKSENWFLSRYDLKDRLVVQYSGHMGEGHDFSTILSAARNLKEHNDIVFLFVGDGPRRKEVETFKKAHNLDNVLLLPYQDKRDLRFSLNAADVALTSLKGELEGLIMPSKIYGIMASGRPVIHIGNPDGAIGRIIKAAQCGFSLGEGDVKSLEEIIIKLYNDEQLRKELGNNARHYFLKNFDRKIATARYYELLNLEGKCS